MKKTFIKVTLFSLLAFGATSSLVSCKDYDDDITKIGQVNDDQAKQLAALETALKAAQAAADAAAQKAEAAQQAAQQALTKGDQALAAAETAKADAAKAIQAAESAKADAIKAAMDAVEAALKNVPSQEELNRLSSKISSIDKGLNLLNGQVDEAQKAIDLMEIQLAALVKYQAEIEKLPKALQDIIDVQTKVGDIETTIDKIKKAQIQLQTLVGQHTDKIDKIEETVNGLSTDVDKIQTNLNILGKELRSLVFIPELYADGIEATEYPYMPYKPMKTDTNQKSKGLTNQNGITCEITEDQREWAFTTGTKQQYYNPIEIVKYHLNPSNAKVAAGDLSLLLSSAETISRGLNTLTTGVTIINDQVKIENGIVSIPYETSGKDIKTGHELNGSYQNATLFRLEAKVNPAADGAEKTVTSDYALFYASTVHPLAVGYISAPEQLDADHVSYVTCTKNAKSPELFKTMEEAIKGGYSYEVQYNNTNGFDLTNLFNVHYDWDTNTSNQGEHKTWTPEQAKKYGLSFNYKLIDYTVGTNGTHDSKYGVIENGKFFPRTVDASGNTTGTTGTASISREPIVRVTVVDENNKVVVVGFVKLRIAKLVEVLKAEFEKTSKFNACDGGEVDLTWGEISSKILDMTAATSKTEFDALYMLDVDQNGEAIQYVAPKKDPEKRSGVGIIKEVPNSTGTTTSVLKWELSTADQQFVYENNDNHTYTTYVRYICKDATAQTAHPMIFVEWTVTITKPLAGKISEKSPTYWYNNNSCVYMNVPEPKQGEQPTTFERNQNSNWMNNKPEFTKVEGYEPAGYKYYFTSNELQGQKESANVTVDQQYGICILDHKNNTPANTTEEILYHLFKANDGVFTNAKLKSGTIPIATIDANGVLTYLENDKAKELLNKYGAANRNVVKDSDLHVNVGIANMTECGYVIPMQDYNYNCYFIRPITITPTNNGKFDDATDNGSSNNVADLLKFVDWRETEFVTDDFANLWLFGYYDVKSIKVELSKATAQFNDETPVVNFWEMFSINEVQLNVKDQSGNIIAGNIKDPKTGNVSMLADGTINLTFKDDYNNSYSDNQRSYDEIVKAMGKITYHNSNAIMQGAKVTIPIEVQYYWGTQKVDVPVVINPTLGN